jgi:hypothetical protein
VCGIAEDALNETPFTNPSFGLEAYVFVPNETIRQDYINDSNWKKVLGPNIANKIKIIGETQEVNN